MNYVNKKSLFFLFVAFIIGCSATEEKISRKEQRIEKIPLIYCSDLYHPHDDPDDHFDIASIYAIPEFDLKAIILDQARWTQKTRPGKIPVEQLNALTGRNIPWVAGLSEKLQKPKDKGLGQPSDSQHAVQKILNVLKESEKPVTIITVGSLRDVAASFNRAPELFKKKVGMLMIFIGESQSGGQEYNVGLDPNAFVTIMNSGLPVYWVPCFDGGVWKNEGNASYWKAQHSDLLRGASKPVINFFIYALRHKAENDHIGCLYNKIPENEKRELFDGWRNLWGSAVFTYAANRVIVRHGDDWVSIPKNAVKNDDKIEKMFTFSPVSLYINDKCEASYEDSARAHKIYRFKVLNTNDYAKAMTSVTKKLMNELSKEAK